MSNRDYSSAESGRDVGETRDVAEGTEQVRNILNVYTQIASNTDLQKLRQQQRGLFDSLLQHAVPFALNAAQAAISHIGRKRDFSSDDLAVQRHLPTAIDFAHQIAALPEVQTNRGLFDKLFSIGMPLVLNTATTLFGAKRGLGASDDAQRGFFDAIIGNLPGTVLSVLTNVGKRDLEDNRDFGDENRDLDENRGFFDIFKKVAPIILNVAGSAVQSLQGQRSLSFSALGRGFFDSIKNVVKKVINLPIFKKIGSAIRTGVNFIFGSKRAIGEAEPSGEAAEANVRGFFGSMLQSIAPIAFGAIQNAIAPRRRDIDGGDRDLAVSQERGIFDLISKYLPTVINIAQQKFATKRALGGATEDESQYLHKVIATVTVPLIAAAKRDLADPAGGERGILDVLQLI